MSLKLVPYSNNNQGCKYAAPHEKDGKQLLDAKPRNSEKGFTFAPRRGFDYLYGYALIKKQKLQNGQVGWMLPGMQFTQNNARVMDAAKEIDRLIRAGGGLPRGWMDKREVAA